MDEQVGPPVWAAVAERAAVQWGVLSLAQLQTIGAGRGAVAAAVRSGRLHRVHRGVYAVGHPWLGREGRALAAVLACGPGAVLSHRSAGRWWGLAAADSGRIDVTAPRTRGAHAGIALHRSRALGAQDTTTHDGMPITTVARALLDLAAILPASRLERALAQAERLRLYDDRAIRDVLTRANGHRGTGPLGAAIGHEPQMTRSELEARFLTLIREAALPQPLVNFTLDVPDHGRLEVDFHWPSHHVVVETDGYETHRTRAAFDDDRRRDAALTAAGYRVLRFTARSDPQTIVRRLRALTSPPQPASARPPAPPLRRCGRSAR